MTINGGGALNEMWECLTTEIFQIINTLKSSNNKIPQTLEKNIYYLHIFETVCIFKTIDWKSLKASVSRQGRTVYVPTAAVKARQNICWEERHVGLYTVIQNDSSFWNKHVLPLCRLEALERSWRAYGWRGAFLLLRVSTEDQKYEGTNHLHSSV